MKLRIIEIDKGGEKRYEVQWKFIWIWISYRFKIMYRLSRFHGGLSGAILSRSRISFCSLSKAQRYAENIGKNEVVWHKRNRIVRVYYNGEEAWVNKNEPREPYASSNTYEWSYDLNYLKEEIDKRDVKTFKRTAIIIKTK
jgi:hypothetical protein